MNKWSSFVRGLVDSGKRLLNTSKDQGLQNLLRLFINHKIANIGEISSLGIDTFNQQVVVILNLKGELGPIQIRAKYRIVDHEHIRILEVDSSREWIQKALNEFITEDQKRINVPNYVVLALSKLLE